MFCEMKCDFFLPKLALCEEHIKEKKLHQDRGSIIAKCKQKRCSAEKFGKVDLALFISDQQN